MLIQFYHRFKSSTPALSVLELIALKGFASNVMSEILSHGLHAPFLCQQPHDGVMSPLLVAPDWLRSYTCSLMIGASSVWGDALLETISAIGT